ncbi:hypothetical protein VP01_2383g1 [Puccinia sorghi]|uniref:Uncharacterized protein n=1 Tax=Puccinia sorghi TaxID=27349 RepID=A0A0L6V7M2_9BASI|nr:hypothetical protein VP01_2383g1 [Puccinia sorghi]
MKAMKDEDWFKMWCGKSKPRAALAQLLRETISRPGSADREILKAKYAGTNLTSRSAALELFLNTKCSSISKFLSDIHLANHKLILAGVHLDNQTSLQWDLLLNSLKRCSESLKTMPFKMASMMLNMVCPDCPKAVHLTLQHNYNQLTTQSKPSKPTLPMVFVITLTNSENLKHYFLAIVPVINLCLSTIMFDPQHLWMQLSQFQLKHCCY